MMQKTAHQVWKEAKELKLSDSDFKQYLKDNGVIATKEQPNLVVTYGKEKAGKILNSVKKNFNVKSEGTGMSWLASHNKKLK